MGCCSSKPRQNQANKRHHNSRNRRSGRREPSPPYQEKDTTENQKVKFDNNPQIVNISDTERRHSKNYSLKNRKRNKKFNLPNTNDRPQSIMTKTNVSTSTTQIPEENVNTANITGKTPKPEVAKPAVSVTPTASPSPIPSPSPPAPVLKKENVEPVVQELSASGSIPNIGPTPNQSQSQTRNINQPQPVHEFSSSGYAPNVGPVPNQSQHRTRPIAQPRPVNGYYPNQRHVPPYDPRAQYMGGQVQYAPQRQVIIAAPPPIMMNPYPYYYDQCYFDPFYSGFYGGYGYDDGFWW